MTYPSPATDATSTLHTSQDTGSEQTTKTLSHHVAGVQAVASDEEGIAGQVFNQLTQRYEDRLLSLCTT